MHDVSTPVRASRTAASLTSASTARIESASLYTGSTTTRRGRAGGSRRLGLGCDVPSVQANGAAGRRRRSAATFGPMERPARFEHLRYVGDKRTQLVYDLDAWDDAGAVEDFVAPRVGIGLRARHARRGPQPWLHAGRARASRGSTARPAPDRRPCRAMNGTFTSGGYTLARHLVVPSGPGRAPPRCDPLPRVPDRPARRPPLGRHVPPAHRPHRPRPRLRGDDVQLPRHRHQHGRLLAAGMGRRPAHGDRLPVRETQPTEVVLVGTNTGGSIAICVGADDPRVRAVGLLSARGPTSTTGPTTRAASSSTPARSAPCARRDSRPRSTSGAAPSAASARSTRPAASRRGRCS